MTARGLLGLRGKIFLGMVGTAVAVLVPTVLVVNYWLSASVDRKIGDDFRRARNTVAALHAIGDSLLAWEGRALGRSPALLAAVEALDAAAVESLLAPHASDAATRDFCAIVGLGGEPFAVGDGAAVISQAPPVKRLLAAALLEEAGSGAIALGDKVCETASAPIRSADRVVGAVLVGKWIDLDRVESLRGMTGSEVALRVGGRITVATLDAATVEELQARLPAPEAGVGAGAASDPLPAADAEASLAGPARPTATPDSGGRLVLAGERTLFASIPIVGVDGAPLGDFLLVQSMDRATRFFDDLRRTILGIGVSASCLAFLFALFISRGMTGSVRALVAGVHEVERGSYDRPIEAGGRDEIGYLARVFDEMRLSLRGQMEEARRLAEDLRAKNAVLEETLSRLRRAQEELLKAERHAVSARMAAQLSHELNNPIAAVQNGAELLIRRLPAGDPNRQTAELIYAEILRMGRLTRQMLGFARTTREQMVPADLNVVITDLLALWTRRLEEKGIRVETRLASGLPRVEVSADELHRVFLNLVVNASESMPRGGLLAIETETRGADVLARVRDTGCGIAPEDAGRIFDAFFTTKSAASGVGLGLSICYDIVARHGGRIDVESAPGKGACFTVTLPAAGSREAVRA